MIKRVVIHNIYQEILAKGHDEDFEPRRRGTPTTAKPGSVEKLAVLRDRVDRGEPLFVPGDETILANDTENKLMGRFAIQAMKGKAPKKDRFGTRH
jgi:hypothetical protein